MTSSEDPFATFKTISVPAEEEIETIAPALGWAEYHARLPAQKPSDLHIKAAELSAPSLLWRGQAPVAEGRKRLQEAWSVIEANAPALADEAVAIASGINSRISTSQRVARQAQRDKRSKTQVKALDPIADFVQLAYRWSRRKERSAKVRPLSASEQIRMGAYWNSENQNVYAQAYKKHLVDLKNALVAGEEIDRLHTLLMRGI